MIDFIQVNAKKREYMYLGKDVEYTGKYIGLADLAERSECMVSRPTLGQRLTCGITKSEVFCWESVMQCLTTEAKVGRPDTFTFNGRELKRNKELDSEFIDLMKSMPVNNSKPLIMQSR